MRIIAAALIGVLLSSCQPEGAGSPGSAPPPADAPAAGGRPVAAGPAGVAAVDDTVASADGVPIHYHAEGRGEPVLVFVHCWSCDSGYWDGQVREFSPRHRVVAIDLAGHGRSGRGRKDWTIASFAHDVEAVIEALDLRKVILIGHSMGGPVALEAARLLPRRVIALIPVDTLQDADREPDPGELQKFMASMEKDFKGFTTQFVRGMFPAGADPKLVARIAEGMSSAPPEIALAAIRGALSYDSKQSLAAVRIPIHAINSGKYPMHLENNRKYAPQFEVEVIPGTGHFLMLEKPEPFNRALARAIVAVAPPAAGQGRPR